MGKTKIAADEPKMVVVILMVGALSFATALAWNDAVQDFINRKLGFDGENGKFFYAGILTAMLVVAGFVISWWRPNILEYIR